MAEQRELAIALDENSEMILVDVATGQRIRGVTSLAVTYNPGQLAVAYITVQLARKSKEG